METSWYGLFDLAPDDTLEVRAGDLQAFLRQQMMGVTNPGLTVATADERKDNLSALAQRLRDCKHREFNDGMDVEYAIEEAIGYNGGSIDGFFDKLADLVDASKAAQPERGGEVFCTISWSRDDVVDAIEQATGVRLERDGNHANEVEAIIDHVIDNVSKGLQDRSTEHGWEVIDALMPDDIGEQVNSISFDHLLFHDGAVYQPETGILAVGCLELDPPRVEVFSIKTEELARLVRADMKFLGTSDLTIRDISGEIPYSRHIGTYDTLESFDQCPAAKSLREGGTWFDVSTQQQLSSFLSSGDAEPRMAPLDHVMDWYVQNFPSDELGRDIDPKLTFDDALKAVSLGSGFYDAIGVGDSVVRGRVFQELADRNGVSYDNIYEAWLHETPVNAAPAPSSELAQGGVSLSEEAALSKQASEQLSGNGHTGHDMQDRPSISDELR